MKKIILNAGDVAVSDVPAVMETVLGSCVAVCIWDEEAKTGGMNHFMLPETVPGIKNPEYCCPESISRLVGELLGAGAQAARLKAKVFGGGRVVREFHQELDVGKENVRAAKELLKSYNIPVVREFTGNTYGLKVIFYPATGKAFVRNLGETE